MKAIAITAATGAALAAIGAPAYAAGGEEGWAQCLAAEMPESTQKWLALPKAGRRAYVDFVLFENNFSRGMDAPLATNDEFRSEFAALRLEAACEAKVTDSKGKPVPFNAGKLRKFLEKNPITLSGEDRVEPEHHVCVAYRDNLIHGLVLGVGSSNEVKLVNPSDILRCFTVNSDGNLREEAAAPQTGSGE